MMFPESNNVKDPKRPPHKRMLAQGRQGGYSIVEMVIVVAIVGILVAFAIPQLASTRRLTRSVAVTRQLATELRYTRQLAMSERQAFTFSYNDTTKEIKIIDNNASGTALLLDATYPETAGSIVISTTPVALGGLAASELSYGIPSGFSNNPLGDGVSMTNLTTGRFNVTFQPDGSVVDANGNPASKGMFIYNNQAPAGTASAISVLGATGRIKVWRYSSSADRYGE